MVEYLTDAVGPFRPLRGKKALKLWNYKRWSQEMKTILMGRGVWVVVERKPHPAVENTTFFEEQNRHAVYLIRSSVDKSMQNYVEGTEVAWELWEQLKTRLQDDHWTIASRAWKDLQSTKFSGDERMSFHISRFEKIFARMKETGQELTAASKLAILLSSLPKRYDYFLTDVEEADETLLTWEHITSRLQAYSDRFEFSRQNA